MMGQGRQEGRGSREGPWEAGKETMVLAVGVVLVVLVVAVMVVLVMVMVGRWWRKMRLSSPAAAQPSAASVSALALR